MAIPAQDAVSEMITNLGNTPVLNVSDIIKVISGAQPQNASMVKYMMACLKNIVPDVLNTYRPVLDKFNEAKKVMESMGFSLSPVKGQEILTTVVAIVNNDLEMLHNIFPSFDFTLNNNTLEVSGRNPLPTSSMLAVAPAPKPSAPIPSNYAVVLGSVNPDGGKPSKTAFSKPAAESAMPEPTSRTQQNPQVTIARECLPAIEDLYKRVKARIDERNRGQQTTPVQPAEPVANQNPFAALAALTDDNLEDQMNTPAPAAAPKPQRKFRMVQPQPTTSSATPPPSANVNATPPPSADACATPPPPSASPTKSIASPAPTQDLPRGKSWGDEVEEEENKV